jgi:hypothetical protein
LPLLLLLFQFLRSEKVLANYVTAAWVTGALVMLIGIIAVTKTKETFAKELDFVEL